MKAHVISLLQSPRRSVAMQRAASAGLDAEFFDAVDASIEPTLGAIMASSAQAFRARYGREQTKGELGNLLSHQALYRSLLLSPSGYHLILEDDFIPLVDAETLEKAKQLASDLNVDVLILGYSKVDDELEAALNITNPLMNAQRVPGTGIRIGQRCHESSCGVVSYLVGPRFLAVMSADEDFSHLTDDWTYHKELGLTILHAEPLCFREDFRRMPSSLESARADSAGGRRLRLPSVLRPAWRRCLGLFRRMQFHARAASHSK
jgi:GR25 family glycosyltransferase involved in LPS biosynthesis